MIEAKVRGQYCGTDIQARRGHWASAALPCPKAPRAGFISTELEARPLLLWFLHPETSSSGTVVEVIGIHAGWALHATESTGKTLGSSYPPCVCLGRGSHIGCAGTLAPALPLGQDIVVQGLCRGGHRVLSCFFNHGTHLCGSVSPQLKIA